MSQWALDNNMKFNIAKSKEIIFSFRRSEPLCPPVTIDNQCIEQTSHAKILGVTISSDLKWNNHVDNLLKKCNKRLFLLVLCKRAGLQLSHILDIYISIIRSVLEYCCVVWHTSLPNYLCEAIEKVQKRALHIKYGSNDYKICLTLANIQTLKERREKQCQQLFEKIKDSNHKLHDLLPEIRNVPYQLRVSNDYPVPKCNSERYSKSFFPYCLKNF